MARTNSPAESGRINGESERQLLRQVENGLRRQLAEPLAGGLYLVSTPIGNLADITLRALAVLARADAVYCEDKRHSSRLFNHFGLNVPLRSYHEHNAEKEREPLLQLVADDKVVALISDAGTPLVSDPGYKLVREARERGLPVTAVPGASAPLTALAAAGLPTDAFHFAGFLPVKQQARRKRLGELARIEATLILFESPKRLKAALADIAELFAGRSVALARELTKMHEEISVGEVTELAAEYGARPQIKGEFVVLIAPGEGGAAASRQDVEAALAAELQRGSLRDAVKAIAIRFDLPRGKVYDMAVALNEQRS